MSHQHGLFSPPRFLPGFAIADEIMDEYVRMAAQWQAEWQRKHEADIMRALTSGQAATVRTQCTGSYPFMIIRVET